MLGKSRSTEQIPFATALPSQACGIANMFDNKQGWSSSNAGPKGPSNEVLWVKQRASQKCSASCCPTRRLA
jgi:hypothetical protein